MGKLCSLRCGPISFFRTIKDTENMRHKRKMFLIVDGKAVSKYAQEILEGWNKLRIDYKFYIHLRNFDRRISARFQMKPMNKKRKQLCQL